MNQSFFVRTFFQSALAILEPQIYIVVEQFEAENISLLSGRLVCSNCQSSSVTFWLFRLISRNMCTSVMRYLYFIRDVQKSFRCSRKVYCLRWKVHGGTLLITR